MQSRISRALALAGILLFTSAVAASPGEPLELRISQALALLNNAEQRFHPPSETWFHDTQTSLREEVERVEIAMEAVGTEHARTWKSHLHWHLLENNLHSENVSLDDLQTVRRWLYSNRKGLEDPLFAELRKRMDEYLDAVFTLSHDNLQATFAEKVTSARRECLALEEDASDGNAVALGRTLGWLERTGQLAEEVAKIRVLLSQSNAQFIISSSMARRLLSLFEIKIDESLAFSDITQAPASGILQRRRTLRIRGKADTSGSASLAVVDNDRQVELGLLFVGQVLAHCNADAGPAMIHFLTSGPLTAEKPIYIDKSGLHLGVTSVHSHVNTTLSGVSARSSIICRFARRRARQPKAQAHMHADGRRRTTELLRDNFDNRVQSAISEIRAEATRLQSSMDRFQEVFAPAVREGAQPELHGVRSTDGKIIVDILGARRNQFGAATPYKEDFVESDFQARVHISFLNNTLETILGGKSLSDEFLMRYAKILQADLPLPLMVHSRAKRWAITTSKYRPLELRNLELNVLQFIMRITAVEIDGQNYDVPATVVTIDYRLTENEFGEHQLVRDGEVQLETSLPAEPRLFLAKKLEAFFAPVLNGGGVAIPDGGVLGAMNRIESVGVRIANDWIVLGIKVPDEVLQEVIRHPDESFD